MTASATDFIGRLKINPLWTGSPGNVARFLSDTVFVRVSGGNDRSDRATQNRQFWSIIADVEQEMFDLVDPTWIFTP